MDSACVRATAQRHPAMARALKALAIDDEPAVLVYLKYVAESEGFETSTAEDGEAGLVAFRSTAPDIVLTDIEMPKLNGLAVLERIRSSGPDTIVVMLTGYDEPKYARDSLQLGANNFLRKPIQHVDLVMILRKYAEVIRGRATRREISSMVERRESTMRLDNRVERVAAIAEYLVEETGDALPAESRLGVRLGLIELLTNAVEHGNLGITFEEKCEAMEESPEAFLRLRRDRLEDRERSRRRVTVEFKLSPDACEWFICDEGEGFDPERFLAAAEGENLLACNGRGILLSLFHFDELEYLGRGNIVRARKRRGVLPAGTQAAERSGTAEPSS